MIIEFTRMIVFHRTLNDLTPNPIFFFFSQGFIFTDYSWDFPFTPPTKNVLFKPLHFLEVIKGGLFKRRGQKVGVSRDRAREVTSLQNICARGKKYNPP